MQEPNSHLTAVMFPFRSLDRAAIRQRYVVTTEVRAITRLSLRISISGCHLPLAIMLSFRLDFYDSRVDLAKTLSGSLRDIHDDAYLLRFWMRTGD